MMKKLVVTCIVIVSMITAAGLYAFKIADKEKVKGWFLAGSYPEGYDIGVEANAERKGHVAYLKSIKPIKGDKFGTMMQEFIPDDYMGKRVRLTGYIKSADVTDWAGIWFRVDGNGDKTLGFDNMQNRPIKGTTDWKKYEIVLDVPRNTKDIAYGVLLSGPGTVWIDDLNFEIVPDSVPKTETPTGPEQSNKPRNGSFEESEN